MKLSDFDFHLPKSLIAQTPSKNRTQSRLLVDDDEIIDTSFAEIKNFLKPNDLLVLNDTKVIPARLFANKESGAKVEIFVERILPDNQALAMLRCNSKIDVGSFIILANKQKVKVLDKVENLYTLLFTDIDILELLKNVGNIPLPPYINRKANDNDISRYQTVYAKKDGAVAAPTAGLHFDDKLLSQLQELSIDIAFITLHVGMGTFMPVKVSDIKQHKIHKEIYQVEAEVIEKIKTAKLNGGRVIAVGTTVMRTLETIAKEDDLKASTGETDIFIYPGFDFKIVDAMITNFHLPKSSLLLLVAAFISKKKMFKLYDYAIAKKYRFFSYGDAMFVKKNSN